MHDDVVGDEINKEHHEGKMELLSFISKPEFCGMKCLLSWKVAS